MRAFFAANHFDDLVQAHLANIDILALALPHGRDPVTDFQAAIDLRRSARHQGLDLGVAVFAAQHGADADQGQTHVNAEILEVGFAEIFGMRIVSLRERVEVKLDLLGSVFLVHGPGEPIVTARDQLRPGLDRMFAQFFLQQLIGDPRLPELIGFGFIFWPGRFLPAQVDGAVGIEGRRLF